MAFLKLSWNPQVPFFFPSSFPFLRFERAIQKKTKHGQMLGREKGFARNTTSSQRKRSCAARKRLGSQDGKTFTCCRVLFSKSGKQDRSGLRAFHRKPGRRKRNLKAKEKRFHCKFYRA